VAALSKNGSSIPPTELIHPPCIADHRTFRRDPPERIMFRHRFAPLRRRLLLLAAATPALAACNGSDEPPETGLEIVEFRANASQYLIGERARLRVRYVGAAGRIEPDIGPVGDDVQIDTPVLDDSRRYRLVIESPGGLTESRELYIPVAYRNVYLTLPEAFSASWHATATAPDGSVIIVGGDRGGNVLSNAVDRFDPRNRRFERIASLTTGRSHHSALTLRDGRILVFGGTASLNVAPYAELIDPVGGEVGFGGTLAQSRHGHAATLLADGRVLVTGGSGRNTAEIWDPATREWQLLDARMRHVREGHSATLLDDGRVLIAGGHADIDDYVFAERFDPASMQFEALPSSIEERRLHHAAVRVVDGAVLLLGGEILERDGSPGLLSSVLRFDPGRERFEPQTPLDTPRTLARCIARADGSAMLFGGQSPGQRASPSASLWRPESPAGLAPMPQARQGHSVDRLPDGRLLILGGESADGSLVDTALIYQ
jgi:hypothetical protein